MSPWPDIPCPPAPGPTVAQKLQNIIDKASAVSPPTPDSTACLDKSKQLLPPTDPTGGSTLVASASDNADAGEWALCKGELDQIE